MGLNNFPIGLGKNNPLINNVFFQTSEGGIFIPPSYDFWVTEPDGDQMITPDGNSYIFV